MLHAFVDRRPRGTPWIPSTPRLLLVAAAAAALTACGSSGDGVSPEAEAGPAAATLVRVAAEPAGSHCIAGGTRVESGADADANGQLADSEVSGTQYVCNGETGAPGAAGPSTLVRVRLESAGANCALGGSAVLAGRDANANGALEDSEAASVAYVCHGTPGPAGSPGIDALVALVVEPAGANCAHGGQRIQSGQDANRNGVLDAGEVDATSFACSAAPADTRWVDVTSAAVQATANTGYLANSSAPVTVLLPASPAVGDWIKVTGVGTGGWTIAQNAGQRITTLGLPGGNTIGWTAGVPTGAWTAAAMSADGARQVATSGSGELYTSADGGAHWTLRLTGQPWSSVATSSDGSKVLAASNGGALHWSTDGGATWSNDGSSRAWRAVASSADGTRLVATAYLGRIWTSSDGGASWTSRETDRAWRTVSSSADGRVLVAGTNNDRLYVSTDYGVTWNARASLDFWWSTAASADGKRLYATVDTGAVWRSDDFGATWDNVTVNRDWRGIATSSDGRYVVATTSGGTVYESPDGGQSWRATADAGPWTAIASSANGLTLLAGKSGGALYGGVRRSSTTTGVAGSLTGGQGDALHLQYVGGGVFMPISYVLTNLAFAPQ